MFKFASESIRPSKIYIEVSFSKLICAFKDCIVTVFGIFFGHTVGPADFDLLLCSNDFNIN